MKSTASVRAAWSMVGAGAMALTGAIVPGTPAWGRPGALTELLDEHVEWLLREFPEDASRRGDERYHDRLTDWRAPAWDRRRAELGSRLERLRAIPREGWGEEDLVDAEVLEFSLRDAVESSAYFPEQMPVTSMDGPHTFLPQLSDMIPMRTAEHRARYAARLEGVGPMVREQMARMREGLAAGRTVPRVVLGSTPASVRAFGRAGLARGVEGSPFYRPFVGAAPDDGSAARARSAIEGPIADAYDELATFLEREYVPGCRGAIAASESVDGAGYYAQRVRAHTTLDLSPREVHELGLREVARLRAEMDAAIDETDWPGRRGAGGGRRLAAFLEYLRSDKRFYYDRSGDMLDDYRALGKRLDPALLALFDRSPRLPWGVRAIPAFASESSPAAYCYPGSMRSGVAGYFMVNVGALDQRPRYGMVSLTMHEAVPGHHFQLALADEMEGVHRFRTMVEFTAYVEGWALYAERLGLELGGGEEPRPGAPLSVGGDGSGVRTPGRGLYADPYDNFGRLSDEIWRATRLVVDTGMHSLGWGRERAVAYMLENTAGTRVDIEGEIDRYISWPGQALAYKVGELRIRALRERAEGALGARFDVRAFHGVVLGAGCVPLEVLERRVDRWIARSGG